MKKHRLINRSNMPSIRKPLRLMFEEEKRQPIPNTLYSSAANNMKLMNVISAQWWHKWCDFCQFEEEETAQAQSIQSPIFRKKLKKFPSSTRNASSLSKFIRSISSSVRSTSSCYVNPTPHLAIQTDVC